MKKNDPLYFKVPRLEEETIRVETWDLPHFFNPVHFHEDCQISYILEGEGTIHTGTNIEPFSKGDILLFGNNMPHALRNNDRFCSKNSKLNAKAISVFFNEKTFIKTFELIPEFKDVRNFIDVMNYGLKISNENIGDLGIQIKAFIDTHGTSRILTFIKLLNQISKCENMKSLSDSLLKVRASNSNDKLNKVYDHLLQNYMMPLKLGDIASLVNMTPNSFCRYFKNRTKKTFSELLIEVRINRACKLIGNDKYNVTEAFMACGYNSSSNFYRHFRKIKGLTPTEYIDKMVKLRNNNLEFDLLEK